MRISLSETEEKVMELLSQIVGSAFTLLFLAACLLDIIFTIRGEL